MEQHVHIVCLQVPYPPDYGGVMDLFYKLVWLKRRGISIQLHCFDDGRGVQPVLEKYCSRVFYYKRKKGLLSFSRSVPYMVNSRRSRQLQENLSKDNHPILLEGIHCSLLLHAAQLKNRRIILRLHNHESAYYQQLARNAYTIFHQWYYQWESRLLHSYEPSVIKKATLALSVSGEETKKFIGNGLHHVEYLPVFLPWDGVEALEGKGGYCLYQGNLSVEENERAAAWLAEQVFANLGVPFIIAGKNPSARLRKIITPYPHIQLVENPAAEKLDALIRDAHIHVLPSFSETGIKFKLLHALFKGRFCIANTAMVSGTGLNGACIIADSADDMIRCIRETLSQPFTAADIAARKEILSGAYDNKKTADRLIAALAGRSPAAETDQHGS